MENMNGLMDTMKIGQAETNGFIAPRMTHMVPNHSALAHTMHSDEVPYACTPGTAYYMFADTADMTVSIRMQPDSGKYEMNEEFIANMEQVDIPAGDKLNQLVFFLIEAQKMFRKEGVL